jgi:HAD superfamily hydrolase (TIGR01509 family)
MSIPSGIKLIIFDLDGTLIDSRDLHYQALNKALHNVSPQYVISLDEHLSTYDGLPTSTKLNMLSKNKGLPVDKHQEVWKQKQIFTQDLMSTLKRDERVCEVLQHLRDQGYLIYIASNCTWRNLLMFIGKLGLFEYIDWFISNEDVVKCKPSPEMYLRCMIRANVSCKETLIVEDSPIGKKSALLSGAHLLPVSCPNDVSISKVMDFITNMASIAPLEVKWSKKCNVVIPMAGSGSRFATAGYTFPKPLIDVNGKPMIEVVVNNLELDCKTAHFIFIVQKVHYEQYDLQNLLNKLAPGCDIIQLDGVTEGAACSVLKAKAIIDTDTPLIIANSDQFVEWGDQGSSAFWYQCENVDGGIVTFTSSHPKWSYALLDDNGFVKEVAEKKVISDHATVGIYYYRSGKDFVKYAEQMIAKNIRVNNEFYVCPVYNEFIQDGKKIKIVDIVRMWGIGVPEDLTYFLNHYQPK